MTYEPDDIAHVRLPLISLFLLVALPAALIPVLQFLSISAAGNGADTAGTTGALSLAAQPGSVVAGSITGLLIAYVIGGRKTMFLAVLSIVVAVAAMLIVGSPATFQWGRTTLNLGAGALLVLPILILGHYGSHRQIAAGMPGLILGPFILVAPVGLLTRPGTEDRIAAITKGLGGIEPMGWLAVVLTFLLVLSLFRAMGRARGGRPNALFSAELRADARAALGFVMTGPQIYALLIAMALAGQAATNYLGDFSRKSPLEGFGVEPTIAAAFCLGFGGFIIARIFGPRRRQHVLATTLVFLFVTTGLMVATDFMFAPSADSPGIFVWPYTQEQLVLLVLTCGAMAMLGASFAMIWLAIVEVGLGVLATILLVTVLVARIAAPSAVPLLPIPDMWLASGLLGIALVLVALGTFLGRRAHNPAPHETPAEFAATDSAERFEQPAYDQVEEPGFEPQFEPGPEPYPEPEPERETRPAFGAEPEMEVRPLDSPEQHRSPEAAPVISEPPAEPAPPATREPVMPDTPEQPAAADRPRGGLPWRRKRAKRDALAQAISAKRQEPRERTEPTTRREPPAIKQPDPPQSAGEEPDPATTPEPSPRHEAVQDTHIDWAKLGATVVEEDQLPREPLGPADPPGEPNPQRPTPDMATPESGRPPAPTPRPPAPAAPKPTASRSSARPVAPRPEAPEPTPEAPSTRKDTPPAEPRAPAQPAAPRKPAFTRHESTAFDFDRLRENTRGPAESKDQPDEEKE